MTTENNVAAQAGDEPMPYSVGNSRGPDAVFVPFDKYDDAYTYWIKEGGYLNGPNMPRDARGCPIRPGSGVQAGDEPMDYAEQLRAAVETVCEGWTLPPGARKTLETALWAPRVSPRATADVERDEIVESNREGWQDGMQEAQQLLADEICKAARYDWLVEQLGGSISIDLDCSKGEIAETIDAEIERATTKPGA